jgi:hypothetical protein
LGKRAELDRYAPSKSELSDYAGTFGERKTWVEGDVLHYQRAEREIQRLVPMIADWFEFESKELYYVRLHFERDESGAVRQLVVSYDTGREDEFARENG